MTSFVHQPQNQGQYSPDRAQPKGLKQGNEMHFRNTTATTALRTE